MASFQLDDKVLPTPSLDDLKDATVVIEAIDDSGNSSSDEHRPADDYSYSHPTTFTISEHPIDEIRELKVAVIAASALLPAKVPGLKLTLIEKNADFGGTWYANIYPGVRCDIPAHVYQSTFSPNSQWSEEYAQGAEILAYWQSVARKHNVHSSARLQTNVLGAYWEPHNAKWRLDLETLPSGERSSESFDFVITAVGHFDKWRLPDYPGIDKYKGVLRHSSNWDSTFDATGKHIATIGNGASGIQVTTELRKTAAHLDHYARSRTWIAGAFSPGSKDRQDAPMYFTPEQLEAFKDPREHLKYRKELEGKFWRNFEAQLADSEVSKTAASAFMELMRKRLAGRPDLLDKLVPDFPPHCRRLTPGPGYLEALTSPNLTFIQTPIDHFTEDGIVTTDGIHRSIEAVICSTGANTDFAPPFPIIAGDLDLSRDWQPDGAFGFPYSYLGVGTPGFPNLAYILGPNAAGPSGTVPQAVETQCTYIAKMLRKISSQGIRSMVPSKAAADDFVEYCDAYFPRMNLSRKCSSWSVYTRLESLRPETPAEWFYPNVLGPTVVCQEHEFMVTAMRRSRPGSAAHLTQIRREPRWEDYEYVYQRPENRFAYFGNGTTKREQDPERDMTPYLRLPEDNDLRDLHERWWDL
ncbi:hypothetical protein LTR56_003137 [Elasticomyces elasticus]|nr:hypothetical protein LTR56_003137 [Elasticomyces elasticus]